MSAKFKKYVGYFIVAVVLSDWASNAIVKHR